MKAPIGKRKVASGVVVALILVSLLVPAALAAPAAPPLNLPTGTITAAYGSYLDPGQPAAFSITLSNLPVGSFDVATGVVVSDGWCLEDAHLLNFPDVTLYSSYATNLPVNLATYTDPTIPAVALGQASLGDPIPWDKLNYLLNHKPAAADGFTVAQNTQAAVKLLIYGAKHQPRSIACSPDCCGRCRG